MSRLLVFLLVIASLLLVSHRLSPKRVAPHQDSRVAEEVIVLLELNDALVPLAFLSFQRFKQGILVRTVVAQPREFRTTRWIVFSYLVADTEQCWT